MQEVYDAAKSKVRKFTPVIANHFPEWRFAQIIF